MTNSDKISDEEFLYRKIAVTSDAYDPNRQEVKPDAFRPTQYDTRGISVDRAWSESHPAFRRIEEAAQGRQPEYYVAVLQVGSLRASGLDVVPDPLPDNPGHALITDLNYSNRRDAQSQEKKVLLAHRLVRCVEGPFHNDAI